MLKGYPLSAKIYHTENAVRVAEVFQGCRSVSPGASHGRTCFRFDAMYDACLLVLASVFTNARSFANITDMSNQRISGNPSGQWHSYSELAPSQTNNNSVPSSGRRASAAQFGGLAPVSHPSTLQPSMVSGSSTAWLHAFRNSSDAGERALAGAVISAIQNGSLALGSPASQSAMRAQYGQLLETTHGTVSLVVNLRTRADGHFDLVSAGMRDSANPNRRVIISAPQNASTSGAGATDPEFGTVAAFCPVTSSNAAVSCSVFRSSGGRLVFSTVATRGRSACVFSIDQPGYYANRERIATLGAAGSARRDRNQTAFHACGRTANSAYALEYATLRKGK